MFDFIRNLFKEDITRHDWEATFLNPRTGKIHKRVWPDQIRRRAKQTAQHHATCQKLKMLGFREVL